MILEEETFEKFGYYPKNLSKGSGKKILAKCEDCGKIRILCYHHYTEFCRSCSHRGARNHFYGKTHTIETKEKMSSHHRDMHGINNPNYGKDRRGANNLFFGKPHSKETKKKMSENHADVKGEKHPFFGKHHSLEAKRKMSNAKKGKNTKEDHPQWRGGISFEPYCSFFNNEFKERVRNYFDRQCYVCGKNEKDNGCKLAIHHVNYDKMVCCNDVKPLFVPLCKVCHSKTNFHRQCWEEFFIVSLEYLTAGRCYIPKSK